jgi:hypothetical protein
MALYVRYASHVQLQHQRLKPPMLRRLVGERILEIAAKPDPTEADDYRLVAWDGPNSGVLLSLVNYGFRMAVISYRIRRDRGEVWIEDILPVYAG